MLEMISLYKLSVFTAQNTWEVALPNKLLAKVAFWRCSMLTLLALLFISPTAYSADSDSCFVVDEIIQGKECTKPNGIRINFSNGCDAPMDARYCLQMINGDWNCGVGFAIKPQAKHSWWTCEGTGQYKIWGRSVNSKVPFPDPHGTYKQQGAQLYAIAKGETEAGACTRAQTTANNGGDCQCEPMTGTVGFQCRIAISALPASAKEPAKVFTDNEFASSQTNKVSDSPKTNLVTTSSSAKSADEACTAARAQSGVPDADCQCAIKAGNAVCRVTTQHPIREPSVTDHLKNITQERLKQIPVDRVGCALEGIQDCKQAPNPGNGVRN